MVRILDGMRQRGKLDSDVVDVLIKNKERIYEKARRTGQKALEAYRSICQAFSAEQCGM